MNREGILPYLYVVPAAAILLAFMVYPVVLSFGYALHTWDGLGDQEFVGLANFSELFRDGVFWHSLKNTFIWVTLSGVLLPFGGLVLALLVEYGNRSLWLAGITRTVLFMPMMMSMVSVGLLWGLIYNPTLGLITNLLSAVGLGNPAEPLNLLGNPHTALFFAFMPAVWQWTGFAMVILSAAIQSIPDELLEAASIDGASSWKQIRHIVVPLLYPTILVIMTINVIGGFKAFDLIYVMTAGGPGEATLVTAIYIFREAFVVHHFGYASTIAVVLFVITILAAGALLRYRRAVEK